MWRSCDDSRHSRSHEPRRNGVRSLFGTGTMPVDRRTFLIDGIGWAAALTVGPSAWRTCGPGGASGPDAAPSGSVVCAGASVPRPVRPLHPDALPRFVDPLPIPPVLEPDGVRPDPGDATRMLDYFRIAMRETELRFHRDVPAAKVWGYGGIVPGPTIEARSGRGVLVEWVNELPDTHFLPIDHSLYGAHADLPQVRTVVTCTARRRLRRATATRRTGTRPVTRPSLTTRTARTQRRSGTTTMRWGSNASISTRASSDSS